MNSDVAWTFMVDYLSGNFRDTLSVRYVADALAMHVGSLQPGRVIVGGKADE